MYLNCSNAQCTLAILSFCFMFYLLAILGTTYSCHSYLIKPFLVILTIITEQYKYKSHCTVEGILIFVFQSTLQ